MTSSPTALPARSTSGHDRRRFAALSALAACFVLVYAAATAAGAPDTVLSTVFTMSIVLVPPLAWWTFFRAPPELRLLVVFLASAGTLWLLGSLIWFYYFVEAGNEVPPPAGPWEAVFAVAYSLALAGFYVATRQAISLRRTALDASVVGVAGIALGAALVGPELEKGLSADSLVTVVRPLFGVATLALIASAALARWHGLTLSVLLLGVAQVFLTVGGIVYSFDAVQPEDVDFRWAKVALLPGVVVAVLACLVIILAIDRPLRLAKPVEIPGHGVGAIGLLFGAVCGLAVTAAVAFYGHLTDRETVLYIGLAASLWIGVAVALRASSSIRALERSYDRLDRTHLALERTRDRLAASNEELARTNVELRSVHTAFEDLLVIADERTRGGLRDLVEDAGEDLARLLHDYLGGRRR